MPLARSGSEQEPSSLVRVARIGKPHGIRGEVTVEVYTDSPERRFIKGATFELNIARTSMPILVERLTLETARWNKKILLLKFTEISDRNTAENLRDTELFAPAGESGEVDGWYAADLVGLAVFEQHEVATQIGEVTDLVTGAAQDLLEVELRDGSRVLLPFVQEIIPEIDVENRAILITPPPGLLELNQD